MHTYFVCTFKWFVALFCIHSYMQRTWQQTRIPFLHNYAVNHAYLSVLSNRDQSLPNYFDTDAHCHINVSKFTSIYIYIIFNPNPLFTPVTLIFAFDSPLSPSVAPSLFHVQLKMHLQKLFSPSTVQCWGTYLFWFCLFITLLSWLIGLCTTCFGNQKSLMLLGE